MTYSMLGFSNMRLSIPADSTQQDQQQPPAADTTYIMDPLEIRGDTPQKISLWPLLLLIAAAAVVAQG